MITTLRIQSHLGYYYVHVEIKDVTMMQDLNIIFYVSVDSYTKANLQNTQIQTPPYNLLNSHIAMTNFL